MEEKMQLLKVEELEEVVGGSGGAKFDEKRKESDDARDYLGKNKKGYSGMKRAELFDEWQM